MALQMKSTLPAALENSSHSLEKNCRLSENEKNDWQLEGNVARNCRGLMALLLLLYVYENLFF